MKFLHDQLREIRKQKNLTQDNMASDLNINQGYYSRIENGEQIPTEKTIQHIMRILGIAREEIVKDDTNIFNNNDSSVNQNIIHNHGDVESIKKAFDDYKLRTDELIEMKNLKIKELESEIEALKKINKK